MALVGDNEGTAVRNRRSGLENITMYDDNAWPDTAPIETFIPERQRPQRVFVAGVAVLVSAGFALLTGLLSPVVAGSTGVLAAPAAVSIGFAVVLALLLAGLGRVILKARKWAPKASRIGAGAASVVYGVFGLVVHLTEDGSGKLIAWLSFGAALAAAVCAVSLLGRQVDEYFDPTPQPSPFAQQQPSGGQPPIGGYDEDWTPPAQRQPPGSNQPGGFLQ